MGNQGPKLLNIIVLQKYTEVGKKRTKTSFPVYTKTIKQTLISS